MIVNLIKGYLFYRTGIRFISDNITHMAYVTPKNDTAALPERLHHTEPLKFKYR